MAIDPQLLTALVGTTDTLRTKSLAFESNDNPYLSELYFDHEINQAGTEVTLRLRLKYIHKDIDSMSTSLETALTNGLLDNVTVTHMTVAHDAGLNAGTTEVNARYLIAVEVTQ